MSIHVFSPTAFVQPHPTRVATRAKLVLRPACWLVLAAAPWVAACLAPAATRGAEQGASGPQSAPLSRQQLIQALEAAQVDAIARAERSVTAIARVRWDSQSDQPQASADSPAAIFPRPPEPTSPDFIPNEFGAGVVVDRRGLILTNYHVLGDIDQNRYFVWSNRRPFAAEVLAADPWTDLAVLKIDAADLEPIVFGDGSKLRKGQFVIALGNPYAIARDGSPSASQGIVANLMRPAPPLAEATRAPGGRETLHHYGTLIQTDARLNLGTSGGALIDLEGRMIGLTTSLAALAGHETAAGYAIAVDDTFQRVVESLKRGEKPAFGFLGVEPEHLALTERQQGKWGVRVKSVVAGAPGDLAGLRAGDVITHVNDRSIGDSNDFVRDLSRLPAGAEVQLTLERGATIERPGKVHTVSVQLMKKHIASRVPAYAQNPEKQWRGLQVDFATAAPQFLDFAGRVDPGKCVGVVAVERDSPAWRAELRAGDFITHVGKQAVSSPEEFFAAAESQSGAVEMRLATFSGDEKTLTVAP